MNGGVNGIRGYYFQYLICIIYSLEENWISIRVEPFDDREKVDILLKYPPRADWKSYQKAVQVKSRQNGFSKASIESEAQAIRSDFPDAHEYELILISKVAKSRLIDFREIEQQTKVKIRYKLLDLEALRDEACRKLDKYIQENYDIQLTTDDIRNLVSSLVGEHQFYAITRREVTRKSFENWLQDWIDSQISFDDYESQSSEKFIRTFGFNVPPNMRAAIRRLCKQSGKIPSWSFKKSQNFLDFDSHERKLKVSFPIPMIISYYLGELGLRGSLSICIISAIGDLYYGYTYGHWLFGFFCLSAFFLALVSALLIEPYYWAERIEEELKRLEY